MGVLFFDDSRCGRGVCLFPRRRSTEIKGLTRSKREGPYEFIETIERSPTGFSKEKKRQSLPPDPRSKSNSACHEEARRLSSQFIIAILLSALSLFSLGAAKVFITQRSPVRSGLEMLIVGGLAAGVAYFVGVLLKPLGG